MFTSHLDKPTTHLRCCNSHKVKEKEEEEEKRIRKEPGAPGGFACNYELSQRRSSCRLSLDVLRQWHSKSRLHASRWRLETLLLLLLLLTATGPSLTKRKTSGEEEEEEEKIMQEKEDFMLNCPLSPLFTAQTDVWTLWIFKESGL